MLEFNKQNIRWGDEKNVEPLNHAYPIDRIPTIEK
jgi:hypothetical protein